jgi:DNA-binding transcriptional LysR family regulator
MPTNVTLRQLEAFIAVSKTSSFSAAARMLHVSQPALSSMIQTLERQLGAALFYREPQGSSLTTTGRELFPAVERLVAELNQTVASVLNYTTPRGGTVTIACIPSLSAAMLPPLISAFEKEFPRVRIVLKDAMTEARGISDMVRVGEVDYGIASPTADTADLEFRKLMDDDLVAFVPHSHPAAKGGSLRWMDLVSTPLIGMSYQSHWRLLVDQAFAQIGVSKRPHHEVSLITTAVGMVRAGLGVAVLPSTAAQVCNLEGVRVVQLTGPLISRPLGFLYRSMTALSPAAARFMSFAEASIAKADVPGA